jgi:hypothetical protein
MASSKRERHRDREPGWRKEEKLLPRGERVFRITEAEREEIAKALRYIDEARDAIIAQQNPLNREIVRELRASADRIYEILNDLEETEAL